MIGSVSVHINEIPGVLLVLGISDIVLDFELLLDLVVLFDRVSEVYLASNRYGDQRHQGLTLDILGPFEQLGQLGV